MRIKFLKRWRSFKVDQLADIADGAANVLIRRGIAAAFPLPPGVEPGPGREVDVDGKDTPDPEPEPEPDPRQTFVECGEHRGPVEHVATRGETKAKTTKKKPKAKSSQ